MPEVDVDDLLTTGQVALALGVSRQHVVNLCNRGALPFVTAGAHRRVHRNDLDGLLEGSSMTRDQRRSLWLGCAVAGKIVRDPDRLRALARRNLSAMRDQHPRGQGADWLAEWEKLVAGPVEGLLAVLTSPSAWARELRQNSPFAGALTQKERLAVLASFRAASGAVPA